MPGWAGQGGQGLLEKVTFEQGLRRCRVSHQQGLAHGGMAVPKPEASVSDEQ